MTPTDEQVERVALALLPKCRAFGSGDMPLHVAREFARAAIAAMPEPWMTIDDNTPANQDLHLGWWTDWPDRAWRQKISYARSTRGGWMDGLATHYRHLPSPPQKDEQP